MNPSQPQLSGACIAPHEFMKPAEVAKLLRVSHHAVLGWIRRGHLTAINLSRGTRPIFRISRDALDEFLREHTTNPVLKTRTITRQRPPEGGPLDPALGESLLKK